MAGLIDLLGTGTLVASPRQATKVLGLSGLHPARGKHTFYVRFRRAYGTGSTWRHNIGFVAKTVDRPTVQPKVEPVKQYNKRRLVMTGVDYSPIGVTLYDTADNAVQQMWDEYARYHVGDFAQAPASYNDDILASRMNGARDGYGYRIFNDFSELGGLNTQYFFEAVDIYQVWGGEYTQTTLINPKISNYAPDPFDFEDAAPATIRLELTYEAIIYANGGVPRLIVNDEHLRDVFGGAYHGDVVNVSGPPRSYGYSGLDDAVSGRTILTATSRRINDSAVTAATSRATSTVGGGVLGRFGNFDFGNITGSVVERVVSGNTSGLGADLIYAATGDATIAGLLNLSKGQRKTRDIAGVLVNSIPRDGSVGEALDIASVALGRGGKSAAGLAAGKLARAVVTASTTTNTPSATIVQNSKSGTSLNSSGYAVANSIGKAQAQIGSAVKSATKTANNVLGSIFKKNPKKPG